MTRGLTRCRVAVLLFSGCTFYDKTLITERPDATVLEDAGPDTVPSDASIDVSQESASDAAQDIACIRALPPPQPSVVDAGGTTSFTVAVSAIDFGDVSGKPEELGYDFDSSCNCQGVDRGCRRPSWATSPACDGPGGRDNQLGALIDGLPPMTGFGSDDWSAWASSGDWSLVLRIRNYNGLPDDDDVRFDWYVGDEYWLGKTAGTRPKWDGTDSWPIRASCLEDLGSGERNLDHPKHFDEHAYVSGGVLVASLQQTEFILHTGYTIHMYGAFVTARVTQGSNGWTLEDGLVAGKWKVNDLLAQVAWVSLFSTPLCRNHPGYKDFKGEICSRTDSLHLGDAPTALCDSISTAFSFTSKPVQQGYVWQDTLLPNPCEPAQDPASDKCGSN